MELKLAEAAKFGNLEECKKLIEIGVDVRANHNLALQWAAQYNHFEVCKLLLEHGADVHAMHDGALQWAAISGYLKVCKLLIEYDADLKVLFTKDGNPREIVYEFATEEQIETARREWKVQKVMDA